MLDGEQTLEISALKVLILCRADVELAAASGKCGMRLYAISMEIRCGLHPSVEELEGYNNIIRVNTERCPIMSLPLLSARCNIKKQLNIGFRGSTMKWSVIQNSAHALLIACLAASEVEVSLPSYETTTRWDTPAPASKTDTGIKFMIEIQPDLSPSPAIVWASVHSRTWHNLRKNIDIRVGYAFLWANIEAAPETPETLKEMLLGTPLQLVTEKNYSTGSICTAHVVRDNGMYVADLNLPLSHTSSIRVIASFFDAVKREHEANSGQVLRCFQVGLEWTYCEAPHWARVILRPERLNRVAPYWIYADVMDVKHLFDLPYPIPKPPKPFGPKPKPKPRTTGHQGGQTDSWEMKLN
jgi:hypothetical protein